MPWALYSASRHGSTRPLGSGAGGLTSSVGGPARGFEAGPPGAFSRRGSRVTTASPLHGRGLPLPLSQRISIVSTPDRERPALSDKSGEKDDISGYEGTPLGDDSEDFQLYGPAAGMDRQTAAQNHWIAAALDSNLETFSTF